MAQLLLLNPSKRGTKKMAKKRRTAKQKAATRKLAAFNRARGSLNKRRAPKRRKARRNPIVMARPNPSRRKTRSVRRAPRQGIIMQTAPVAVTAALGALGLDVLMGYAGQYIPAQFQNGYMSAVVKSAGAIGLGMIVQQFGTKKMAKEVIIGGLTVTLHSVFKELLAQSAPNIPLGYVDMGFYSPAAVVAGGEGEAAMGWQEGAASANNY